MYIELDGDDIAVTYIKDVVFNANRQDVETLRMTKVPSQSHVFDVKWPNPSSRCLWAYCMSLQCSHLLWWTNGSLEYSRTSEWTTRSITRWIISAVLRGAMQYNADVHISYLKYMHEMLNILVLSLLTLQNDVKSPKSTRHSCQVMWRHSGGQDEIKTVQLVIETTPTKIDHDHRHKSNLGTIF